jgi:hypothetical protein
MQVDSAVSQPKAIVQTPGHRRTWFYAILILSVILRLFVAWRGGAYYWTDEKRYNASRETVAALIDADWSGAARFLFSNAEHIGFRFVMLPSAFVERLFYGDDPPHAKIAATWLGLFSAGNLALIWRITRQLSFRAAEAEWALTFAAASNALFFFSRHCFPYDAALTFFLFAVYQSVNGRHSSRAFLVGISCGLGYLIYNGYWSVGAVVCSLEIALNWRSPRLWRRVALASVGLLLPIAIVFGAAALFGFNLVSDSVRFAGTVNQGDFGEGWRLIGEYLWVTDGFLPVALVVIIISGTALALRRRTFEPWLRWIAIILLLFGIWIFFSDVIHQFVLYGRTVRAAIPFLAMAAAGALTFVRDSSRSSIRQLIRITAITGCVGGGAMMVPPLRQIFPLEFRALAAFTTRALRADDPGAEFRVLFDNYQFAPTTGGELPPHRDLISRPHPHQYAPYLYEGYTRAQRPLYLKADIAMRLIQLDPTHGLDHFEFSRISRSIDPYPGPLLVRFRLPRNRSGAEWIVQHGPESARLGVLIQYLDRTRIRIGLSVQGSIADVSDPIAVNDDQAEHTLLLLLSPLFPPGIAPGGLSGAGKEFRGPSRIALDGRSILVRPLNLPPSGIDSLRLGSATHADAIATPFSGALIRVSQLDPSTIEAHDRNQSHSIEGPYFGGRHGVLELRVQFPEMAIGRSEILIASGTTGRGDQLFVSYVDPHHVRFGIDHWGNAPLFSKAVAISPGTDQDIVVSFGSFFPPQDDPRYLGMPGLRFLQRWLFLRVNDVVLFSQPFDFYEAQADDVTIGWSTLGSSHADSIFSGQIFSVRHRIPEELGLIESQQAWPTISGSRLLTGYLGAMNLQVKFPSLWEPGREPLLMIGIPPNVDVIFVRYVGNSHIYLEYRHGTDQPIRSKTLIVRGGETHIVGVSLASLRGVRGMPGEIAFDGEQVLRVESNSYDVSADSVFFGNTPMDMKWLRTRFSGAILQADLHN